MKLISLTSLLVVPLTILLVRPVHADTEAVVMHDESRDGWVFFGGCDRDLSVDGNCVDGAGVGRGTHFVVGDYNLKQGVYQLSSPILDSGRGKVVLEYSYKFVTEEATDSDSTDQGIIKLKDVNTNEIYYQKILTPADESDKDFVDVRVVLPNEVVTKHLQLVFETVNDAEKLSTLAADAIWMIWRDQPALNGNVYYNVAGKQFPASGALVALQNSSRTKTYQYTWADDNGDYAFSRVKANRRLVVAATLDERSGLKYTKKLHFGSATYNVRFRLH